MTSSSRRFEFLLPVRFNDGRPIPDDLIGGVLQDLKKRFGGVSVETGAIRGLSEYHGKEYRDDLFRVCVDVPDVPENLQFFRELKEHLKVQFEQIDIWMTTHPVDII